MLNMKKDMGGAATMLALAHMLMGRGAQAAAARADPGGREFDLRLGLPPARHLPLAQGPHRRDRQHRRRGPPHPRRRAGARRRGEAGADRRHGDADRRRARRARHRAAAVLHRRRRARRRARALRRRARTIRSGGMPLWRPYDQLLEFEGRRHQQRRRPAVSPARSPLRCSCGASSTAAKTWLHCRHLRLEPDQPSPAGRKAANARPRARSMRCSAARYG